MIPDLDRLNEEAAKERWQQKGHVKWREASFKEVSRTRGML